MKLVQINIVIYFANTGRKIDTERDYNKLYCQIQYNNNIIRRKL